MKLMKLMKSRCLLTLLTGTLCILASGYSKAYEYPYYIRITPGVTDQGVIGGNSFIDGIDGYDADGNPTGFGPAYAGGSWFGMPKFLPQLRVLLVPNANFGFIALGTHQPFVLDPDEPHPAGHPLAKTGAGDGYAPGVVVESNILEPFSFFGGPTYVGTNPVGYQSGDSHVAPILDIVVSSCQAPPGVIPFCNITADLSSWEVKWSGFAFEQGPRPDKTQPFVLATGKMEVGGRIILDWSSEINGGIFDTIPGVWHIEGQLVQFAP